MPVTLGGQTYLASELRLRDLAQLEAWAIASLGSQLDGLGDDASAEELREAWLATENGSPALGSPLVDQSIFATLEGRSLFLLLVLRDDGRKLTSDQAREIAASVTAPEWDQLDRRAFSILDGDFQEIVRRVDKMLGLPTFVPVKERSKTVPWPKAVAESVELYHLSFADLAELTLGQWRVLRSGGESDKFGEPMPADSELEDRVMTARGEFWAGHTPGPPADSHEDLQDEEEVEDGQ